MQQYNGEFTIVGCGFLRSKIAVKTLYKAANHTAAITSRPHQTRSKSNGDSRTPLCMNKVDSTHHTPKVPASPEQSTNVRHLVCGCCVRQGHKHGHITNRSLCDLSSRCHSGTECQRTNRAESISSVATWTDSLSEPNAPTHD